MPEFDLVITEVTEMRGSYCVAGWSSRAKRMVRPLPGGEYWSLENLRITKSGDLVKPGLTIRFSTPKALPLGDFPHRTENLVVDKHITGVSEDPSFSWFGDGAPEASETLVDIFPEMKSENLEDGFFRKNFVPASSHGRSLWGLIVTTSSLEFNEKIYNNKKQLRAKITDLRGRYNLPVAAKNLKEAYRNAGIDAVTSLMPSKGKLHIRIGLARPFAEQANKCYVMINGVNW